MRGQERIPLHDHVDNNSGGKIDGGSIVQAVGGEAVGAGGGRITTYAVALDVAAAFNTSAGTHQVAFDTIWQATDPFGGLGAIPAELGLTLVAGDITATEAATWVFWLQATGEATNAGFVTFGHPNFASNPRWAMPYTLNASNLLEVEFTCSLNPGDTILVFYENTGAAVCVSYIGMQATRISSLYQQVS